MTYSWLLVEGDTHGGNIHGLMNPDIVLYRDNDKGDIVPYTPAATETQKYLWLFREQCLQKVANIIGKDKLYYIHTGDQTQGDKYVSEWVSTRKSDQIAIAFENTQRIVEVLGDNLSAMRFAKGTVSHEFGEGTSANILQSMYTKAWPDIDIKTVWHGLVEIEGVSIDYAHHGPFPGSRRWLKGNSVRYYIQDRMLSDMAAGRVPPRLMLRGHYHELIWETVRQKDKDNRFISTDLIIVPPQCGIGAFGRQVTRSMFVITNGMILIKLHNRNIVDVIPLTKTVDIRTKEILS